MAPKQNPKTTSSATSQPSKLSEIVASNVDLLIQILLKLSLKPLMKFTSVSKHCLSLIYGPDFCHRRNPPCCVSGLFIEPPWDITELDFVDLSQTSNLSEIITFVIDSSRIKILHSCNGLLLCSTNEAPEPCYVNNPTTNKYAILPPLPFPYRSIWGMSLAFDPSKSSHYKVVCVLSQTIYDDDDDDDDDDNLAVDDTQIVIYSSETETWRLSGDSFYVYDTHVFMKGVFWNGSLHWIELFGSMYFNVDEERLGKMPIPPVPAPDDLTYFVESGGHLYLIYQLYHSRSLPGFDIYEIEMNYSGWFHKFRVDLSEFPAMFLDRKASELHLYFFKIVHIVSGAVDKEAYAVIRIPGMVIRYNFKSKAFDKLCDIEAGAKGVVEWGDAHQYIESLAFV